jgi:hypothetical protein
VVLLLLHNDGALEQGRGCRGGGSWLGSECNRIGDKLIGCEKKGAIRATARCALEGQNTMEEALRTRGGADG